jgi:asparagine synthase (glutamine-hydrolysing)
VCGIFGIIGHRAPVAADILERATQSLTHRGPDDGGTIILRDLPDTVEVGFGNRRLAILDLSPLGHQPMHDPLTGNWIAYNGEIYNFREIRGELQQQGVHFSSHSDTEVVLKAYGRWAEHCLEKFRGMFAFAIWDAPRQLLFAARDPMGIKPFYYHNSGQYFLFSSEVRTLLGTGLTPRRIDPAGLMNYLTFGSLYDPATLIEGVRALPAGHYLILEKGQERQVEYWDLAKNAAHIGNAREDGRAGIEAQVKQTLAESVRMQLVSDVPVGVFLSGGIDSSSLVALLAESGLKPSTFSIVFREPDYSEAKYSQAVAEHFHTDHHEILVSASDLFEAISPAVRAMDLPTIDGINTYLVAERTRAAGVKVALSGLGGDEMFAGYSSFHAVPRVERFSALSRRVPRFLRASLAEAFSTLAGSSDQNRKLAALLSHSHGLLHAYFLSRMLFTPGQRDSLLRHPDPSAAERAEGPLKEKLKRIAGLDPINRVSYLEARCYMLNTLLRDSDFMSMAHGLEVRVPLIDHQLAQQLIALPGSWKLNAGTPKPLLVHALRAKLPESIIHRRKRGFTLPFEHWLHQELRPQIETTLARTESGPLGELLNASAVRRVWKDFLQEKTSWSRPWSLYVLQSWCEQHLPG